MQGFWRRFWLVNRPRHDPREQAADQEQPDGFQVALILFQPPDGVKHRQGQAVGEQNAGHDLRYHPRNM